MKSRRTLQAMVLAAATFFLASPSAAQVSTSSIRGTVVDTAGLAVVGAKVVAKNEAMGVTYETSTTSSGDYTLSALPPGQYTITVSHPGFRTFSSVHNVLTVGAPLVVDAKLQLGAVSEVVQVESSYARIETSSAMVSNVVTRREVVELPLNGRNPLNLIALEPGIVQRTNNASGSGTHVFGSRDRAHNVTVDGIDGNESSVPNPQNNILRLNPDNVQEYRVVTHNATPEYGRNSGANVAIATRSGTNNFHGDVFWFHRNTVLNANEWFNKAKAVIKPVLLLNQPGGAVGGPIIKNKTFFFASAQVNRIRLTEPIAQAFGVPIAYTQTMKNGIFRFVKGCVNPVAGTCSAGQNGPNDFTANSPALVDANGNLLPGVRVCASATDTNCIASYNIFGPNNVPSPGFGPDAKIAAMINTFPLPNSFDVGDGLNFSGFVWNVPSAFSGTHLLFRVDHKFDDNNNVFVRYIHSNNDTTRGDLLNARPSVFPGFPPMGEVFRVGRNLAVSYRRVFSPNVVNEFTTGFNYFRFRFTFGESNPNFGDFTKVPPFGQQCVGQSFRNITTPFCDTPHTQRGVSALQWIDNLSIVHGSHAVRTGINFRFYRHNDSRGLAGGQNTSPTILFNGNNRLLVQTPTGPATWRNLPPPRTGISSSDRPALLNAIAELAGIPAESDQAFAADLGPNIFGGLQVGGTRAKQYDWYIQDEWKITRNLTMTYGVRWEFNQAPTDCCGRVLVPDRAVDGSQGTVTFMRAERWFQRNNATAFAPRVSVAWNPRGGKTVVRAGYGIAFDTISTFQITAIGGQVPGVVLNCRLTLSDGKDSAGNPIIKNALTKGCTPPSNITSTISGGFPLQLPLPTAKPSESFSPPPQAFSVAPGSAAFDQDLKVPTVHEWSLTIQRELPWGFVGQIGYIGKRGMRLYRAYDINQPRADRPEFLQSFLIARNNVGNRCLPDGTGCPPGVSGTTPDLLLKLTGSTLGDGKSLLNTTSSATFIRNGAGDLALRVDQFAFNVFSANPAFRPNFFRPNAQFTRIFYFDSGGDSYYHGAIVQLRRRFEKGLTMGLAYTFGKSIDDMSVDPVGASSGGAISAFNSRTPTDVRNFRLDRSRSDFDNRHTLTVDWLYELPFGHGKRWGTNWPGFLNQLLGGWNMSGIYIYQSGEPFTINSGSRTQNGFKVSRAELVGPMPSTDLKPASDPRIVGPVVFNVSPVLVSDPRDTRFKSCKQVIGTQSFFCVPAAGQTGIGRNTVQGPGFWNLDFGALKNFPVSERVKLEFRAEFFNIFNHPNYENPRNATDGSPTLTSSLFGRTCCVTSSLPNSTAVIADGEPNRVIQFAFKVNF